MNYVMILELMVPWPMIANLQIAMTNLIVCVRATAQEDRRKCYEAWRDKQFRGMDAWVEERDPVRFDRLKNIG